jgi:serine/threonine-protein kinase
MPRGASWGDDGNIIAALNSLNPLSSVPATSGTPRRVTKLASGEITHRWPQVLPGSQAVLFTASPVSIGLDDANINVTVLKTGVTKILQRGGYYGRYLPSGHLIYLQRGVLFGVGFDAERLELRGTPAPLVEDIAKDSGLGGGQFDFSTTGTLTYLPGQGAAQTWPIGWLDSSGKLETLLATPGAYYFPRFSPEGQRLAFVSSSKGQDIFVYDLERRATTRLTFDARANLPVWSPDGKHIVYRSAAGGFRLWWVRSDGAGEPVLLLENQDNLVPTSFSPDGRRLAYQEVNPETGYDLWTLPLDLTNPDRPKPGTPELFLRTPVDERSSQFSPDGRWIAYRSTEPTGDDIFVRPFPGPGGRWQVSAGGGLYAFWSKNGHELFYEAPDRRIMVVEYTARGDSFMPGPPRVWCDRQIFNPGVLHMDLAPDGKRFAVLVPPENARPEKGSVHVVFLQNFFDELRRRVPTGGK